MSRGRCARIVRATPLRGVAAAALLLLGLASAPPAARAAGVEAGARLQQALLSAEKGDWQWARHLAEGVGVGARAVRVPATLVAKASSVGVGEAGRVLVAEGVAVALEVGRAVGGRGISRSNGALATSGRKTSAKDLAGRST